MRRLLLAAAAVAGFAPAAAAQQDVSFYVGQTMTVAFSYCPEGWMPADGRLLPINSYQVLYSLILTTYGGDGTQTFALPDLRGQPPASGQTDLLHCIAVTGYYPSQI